MEIDSPKLVHDGSPSPMAELMGSPLFTASKKLRRSRTSLQSSHHRSGSAIWRQSHTMSTFSPNTSSDSDKESPTEPATNFRTHARTHSSSFKPPLTLHSHARHSSGSSIFKIHNRTASTASSRGLQEALEFFSSGIAPATNTSTPNTNKMVSVLSPETSAALSGHRQSNSDGALLTKSASLFKPLTSTPDKNEPLQVDFGDSPDFDTFGSPLQQRQQTRRRLALNAQIKHNLRRATSLINCSPLNAGRRTARTLGGIEEKEDISRETTMLGSGNSQLRSSSLHPFFLDGCTLPYISVDEFHTLLTQAQQDPCRKVAGAFDSMSVVDCRFEYEYQGGHIDGAINISSKSELEQVFFSEAVVAQSPQQSQHRLLVFHCEFSSHRGPIMADSLRSWDRSLNRDNYPALYYPDIVILEGGYKKYYDKYMCHNNSYVEMQDPQFRDECERGLDKLRHDSKLSLSRKSSCLFDGASVSSATSSFSGSFSGSFKFESALDFGSSSKLDLGRKQPQEGIFGGAGNRTVDLDSLYRESPKPKPLRSMHSAQGLQGLPGLGAAFKQPSLPRRSHQRAETIGCFEYDSVQHPQHG